MTIACVDNTPVMLQSLKENADKVYPHADAQTFRDAKSALEYVEEHGCDVFLCEINPPWKYHICYSLLRKRTCKGGNAP